MRWIQSWLDFLLTTQGRRWKWQKPRPCSRAERLPQAPASPTSIESDNQNPALSHTVNPASVFWQAVLCKQHRFLEQLSCRIFIVWLRFQWEISTSFRGIGAAQRGGGCVWWGGSHFPYRPELSDQRTDLLGRWWIVQLRLILFEIQQP